MRLPSGPVLVEPRQNLDPSSNNACTRDLSRLRVSQNYYGDIYIYYVDEKQSMAIGFEECADTDRWVLIAIYSNDDRD